MKIIDTGRTALSALFGRVADHYLESLGLGYLDNGVCLLCGQPAGDLDDVCDRCAAVISEAVAPQLPPPADVIAAAKAAHPAYMKRAASAGMTRHELVLLRRRAEADPGGVTWVEIQRLVEEADRLHLANADVAAIHVPEFIDLDGHRQAVVVEVDLSDGAQHVCRTGNAWDNCNPATGFHLALGCGECAAVWPCATARLITGTAVA